MTVQILYSIEYDVTFQCNNHTLMDQNQWIIIRILQFLRYGNKKEAKVIFCFAWQND